MKTYRPLVSIFLAALTSSIAVAMLITAPTAVAANASVPYGDILTEPGRMVETDIEKELGAELHNYYLSLGMKLVTDVKCARVWGKLAPIFKRSFSRTDFDLYVFDRPDPDVFNIPGHIYVSTGTAAVLNDSELAEVIAHEFMHMIDSSALKAWQADLDKGNTLNLPPKDIQGVASLYRGDKDYVLPYYVTLEDTALNFSLEMAQEAGYPAKSMADAWEKLRKARTVEFEDYLGLHSLDGPMWTIMSSRINAFSYDEWQTGSPEVKAASAWSLDSLKLDGTAAQYVTHFGAINPGSSFAVDQAGGQVAFLPGGVQYWKIFDREGRLLRTLDDRDNLSLQYFNLDFSPKGDRTILNTQQDVIAYDSKTQGSVWLGLGSISKVSNNGSFIAYSDYGDIVVKEIATGKIIFRANDLVQGSIKSLTWSPDDNSILYQFDENGKTYLTVVDISTGAKANSILKASAIGQIIWTLKGIGTLTSDGHGISFVLLNYDHEAGTLDQTFSKVLNIGPDVQGPFITDLKDTGNGIYAAVSANQKSIPRLFVTNLSTGQSQTYRLPDQSVTRVNQVRWLSAPDTLIISDSTL